MYANETYANSVVLVWVRRERLPPEGEDGLRAFATSLGHDSSNNLPPLVELTTDSCNAPECCRNPLCELHALVHACAATIDRRLLSERLGT